MKNKKTKVGVITLFVVIGILGYLIIKNYYGEFEIKEKYSFSEISNTDFSLKEEEQGAVIEYLKNNIYEDDKYFGLYKDNKNINLYEINAILEMAKTIKDSNVLDILKTKKDMISKIDVKSLGILDLIYYINICKEIKIEYDKDEIVNEFEKFYDKKTNLFFMNDSKDTENMKIIITALCCNTNPELVNCDKFNLLDGIKETYKRYEFKKDKTVTLYNSGGDIIYCYSVLGLIDENFINENREWFEYWRKQYESTELKDINDVLMYCEFYNIACIFDQNYSKEKIQKYYNNLTENDIYDGIDIYMINNIVKNTNWKENKTIVDKISELMKISINTNKINSEDIDVFKTVYGIVLYENLKIDYDKEKLQNYINLCYKKINKMENTSDVINNLYYTIILDQINNDYKVSYNEKEIQDIIDESIKNIDFEKEISNNIVISRKILEIIMDLQIHEVNIKISNSQKNKIKEGLELASKTKDICDSVLITDLYIIDKVIDADIISDKSVISTYKILSNDGGSRLMKSFDKEKTDLNTTYSFFVCFDRMNNYKYLEEQKMYVKKLQKEEGIYKYSNEQDSYFNSETIVFGNAITKIVLGGSK